MNPSSLVIIFSDFFLHLMTIVRDVEIVLVEEIWFICECKGLGTAVCPLLTKTTEDACVCVRVLGVWLQWVDASVE